MKHQFQYKQQKQIIIIKKMPSTSGGLFYGMREKNGENEQPYFIYRKEVKKALDFVILIRTKTWNYRLRMEYEKDGIKK